MSPAESVSLVSSIIVSLVMSGGVLLAAHWFYLRPKIRDIAKEEIGEHVKNCPFSLQGQILLQEIQNDIMVNRDDFREFKKEIRGDIKELSKRFDKHMEGHSHG